MLVVVLFAHTQLVVRKSIEEKLKQIDKKIFEEKMKTAYKELAQKHLNISEDFRYVDAENLH